jgi:hypothetical protein
MKRMAICAAAVLLGTSALVGQQLPSEPPRQFGRSVTGAFEGWFASPGGQREFLVGYFNRNQSQQLDIPIGPANRIEPGGPDFGQPTHFMPGRQHGMFVVAVPANFSPPQELTWTIIANGQTTTIPLTLNRDYVVSPFSDVAVNNTPPAIRLGENDPIVQGPVASLGAAPARTVAVSTPLELTIWATDDEKYTNGAGVPLSKPRPPVTVTWTSYRGPAPVTFATPTPKMERIDGGEAAFSGKAETTATFSEPGEYVLHVTANDYSGAGGQGELCCWTTAMVKVSVTR